MKTPPRDPWKRTCGTVVTHLGAYKSQLVVIIVPYIYTYIFIYYVTSLIACLQDSVSDGSIQRSILVECVCIGYFICTIWQHVSLFREHFLKSCFSHLNFKPDGSRGNTASFLLRQIPMLIHCTQVFTWIPILVTAKPLFLMFFLQQPQNRCRKCYI